MMLKRQTLTTTSFVRSFRASSITVNSFKPMCRMCLWIISWALCTKQVSLNIQSSKCQLRTSCKTIIFASFSLITSIQIWFLCLFRRFWKVHNSLKERQEVSSFRFHARSRWKLINRRQPFTSWKRKPKWQLSSNWTSIAKTNTKTGAEWLK